MLAAAVGLSGAAGIYVSEYRHTAWARIVRYLSDVLVRIPSVVLGYFGYITMVEWLGWHFSVGRRQPTVARDDSSSSGAPALRRSAA
jgi:phosphate transport system permease protein